MNNYKWAIQKEIEKELLGKDICLVRIEGIENPIVYKDVCRYFEEEYRNQIEFIAKLSNEKYKDFKGKSIVEWEKSLQFLETKNENGEAKYIDTDGAMTKWRNETVNKKTQKPLLVLLMGTEMVKDIGGLADFYRISPDTILSKLSKDYSLWFESLFEVKSFEQDKRRALDNIFKVLFRYVNVDLLKYSTLIDELENSDIYDEEDLVQQIFRRLDVDWNIPSVFNPKKVPSIKRLLTGSKSCEIIAKAYKFINRENYKNLPTRSQLKSINEKIDKYELDKNIAPNTPFPEDEGIFDTYSEFKASLLDFVNGRNVEQSRKKFLKIDFGIIDEVLGVKTGVIGPPPQDNIIKVTGEPIQAYTTMILQAIHECFCKHGRYYNVVEIKVDEIKLANCISDDEYNDAYANVCSFLGGIIKFLSQEVLVDEYEENIIIKYYNDFDPFDYRNLGNSELISISQGRTRGINDLSKISFRVNVGLEDERESYKYRWEFESQSNWQNAFCILSKYVREREDQMLPVMPIYAKCNNIYEYVNCESDDEYFKKLEKIRLDFEDKTISDKVKNIYSDEIYYEYENVVAKFGEFMEVIVNDGFFNAFNGESNIMLDLIQTYTDFMWKICLCFDSLTSVQKDNLYLFLNAFLISKDNGEGIKTVDVTSAIVPPYHPVLLEKIFARMIYVRKGFVEVFNVIKNNKNIKTKEINIRLDKYNRLSNVISAVETLLAPNNQYLICNRVHGYYAVYNNDKSDYFMLSDNVFDRQIVDDEDIDGNEILKKTHQSNIIFKNILDYITTFPSKVDGINVLVVNPIDMQHIVSGIHSVVTKFRDSEIITNINLRVLVSDNRKNGADYLRYWLDNYFNDDDSVNVKTFLNYVNFCSPNIDSNLRELVKEQDVCFVYNVLSQKSVSFGVDNSGKIKSESKFPMTFMPEPVSKTQDKRSVNISQFQFLASKAHTQLAHLIRYPNDVKGNYRILKELSINDYFEKIIDVVHEKSKWVICVDEAIDRSILNNQERKIIGFTTGEGCFGELNVTVSAREDILTDIEQKLKNRIVEEFISWQPEMVKSAAKFCIDLTKELDGSKILKALNPRDYEIHNFLAYVLTLQILKLTNEDNNYYVRSLINLDSHRHWFDANFRDYEIDKENRPDFLLLEIPNIEQNRDISSKLKIKATIIECKMGRKSIGYLEHAQQQLEHGIKVLSTNWDNDGRSVTKRYWFNQLYRALIFSRLNIDDNDPYYCIVNSKIRQILEGNFEMEWDGKIFAFWLDENSDEFVNYPLNHNLDHLAINLGQMECYTGGQLFIQKMLVPQSERNHKFVYDETLEQEEFAERGLDSIGVFGDDNAVINASTNKNEDQNKVIESIIKTGDVHGPEDTSIVSTVDESQQRSSEGSKIISNESSPEVTNIRVLLGEDLKTKEKMYWEFGHKQLNNRHLLISGNSGSGKTYCIQCLLFELAMQGVSSVIFDYTDGFKTSKLDPIFVEALSTKIEQRYVKIKKFPINPFKKQLIEIGDEYIFEDDIDVANRMAAVFTAVYKFGPQQNNVVYEAIKNGYKKYGNKMNFELMAEELDNMKSATVDSVKSKVKPFLDINPFTVEEGFDWQDIINAKGMIYIIQLTGFDRQIQIMLTEIVLWDIWNYCVKNGDEKTPFPIVLDEAQNLNHGLNSPSGKILTEGRKFGLSGWFATQFMKGQLKDDEMQRLQQAGQKLYFCPPEKETNDIAKNIDINAQNAKEWAEKLTKLKKGECVTCGSMMKRDYWNKYEPKIIKITSLEERVNGNR